MRVLLHTQASCLSDTAVSVGTNVSGLGRGLSISLGMAMPFFLIKVRILRLLEAMKVLKTSTDRGLKSAGGGGLFNGKETIIL